MAASPAMGRSSAAPDMHSSSVQGPMGDGITRSTPAS